MNSQLQNYSFNPYTGNQLKYEGGSKYTDVITGQDMYLNPKPACAAIIEGENKQILLVQRKKDPGKNQWDLPGGFVEINETLEQAIERELKEEIGAQIKSVRYFGSAFSTYHYGGITYPIIDTCFTVKLNNDLSKFDIDDDVADWKWVSYHSVDFDEIHGDSIKKFIKIYFSHM